ncbi:MAG TPA: thiol:disulfide interchange protein [Halomonas campaniensis]|uniref:Thiol:disulfide interchange protein n=2 Tax=Oceanospirillales TaxID=135619 RepID=A0A3D0KD91_9GAMM|nr:thioredoxin family protein [Halomonas sp. 3F2F]HBS82092.1 thiol:disulfide interchange protein [Halomonas campaniensis]HCA01270.1 thiol:disulfide interchange protein [Halomonas campaniensis]
MPRSLYRYCVLFYLAFMLLPQIGAAQEFPGTSGELLIKSSLIAETDQPAAGTSSTLAVFMEPQSGWHGYWKQPGSIGLAPQFDWQLPDGVSVGDASFPVPHTLMTGDLMNHVFEHPYALLLPVEIDGSVAPGTPLPITVDLNYLACRADACVPEQSTLAITLTAGDGHITQERKARFDEWRRELPRPLGSQASFVTINDARLRVSIPLPASVTLNDPHLFVDTDNIVDPAAEQIFSREGDVLIVETQRANAWSANSPPTAFEALLSLGTGTGLTLVSHSAEAPAASTNGYQSASSSSSTTIASATNASTTGEQGSPTLLLTAFFGALLGGVLLNIMPCVFPILSLKVLSLARLTGGQREARREALAYTAGVVIVCLILGATIIALRAVGTQVGWAFQLQDPRVLLVLTLLTAAIGFNLAGLFELGSINAGGKLASQDGVAGAFWTGVLAAFVATPCSGPFMATALGAALVLPTFAALTVFAGLGLGIALPFLLLGFVPVLRRLLPRPGPWLANFRHIMAIPMFLTALALAWVLGRQLSHNGMIASLALIMLLAIGLWFTGLRQRSAKRLSWLPAGLAAGLALTGSVLVPGAFIPQAVDPNPLVSSADTRPLDFNANRLAELRQQGHAILVYFSADWCVTCKINEQRAINTPRTQQAFEQAEVITMKGDWTNGDPAITTFLEQHGRSGVPLYLWYAPGATEPEVLSQLLAPNTLSVLASQLD